MSAKFRVFHSFFLLIFVLLVFTVLTACGSGSSEAPGSLDEGSTEVQFQSSATILITDTQGRPLQGVEAKITYDKSTRETIVLSQLMSDENGKLKLIDLPDRSTVRVNLFAQGFSHQVVVFNSGNQLNPVNLSTSLIARQVPQIFNAEAQAILTSSDGAKVVVPANAFIDENGNKIEGDIEVTITPIDVSSQAQFEAFPGSFRGVTENIAERSTTVTVASYGAVEYEFTQNGKEVQLKTEVKAHIQIPIYFTHYLDGRVINTGDKIPFWFLHEDTGFWEQEGMGVIVGSVKSPTGLALEGEVSHFSWWNSDVTPETATVDISVNLIGEGVADFSDEVLQSLIANVQGRLPGGRIANDFQALNTIVSRTVPDGSVFCVSASIAIPIPIPIPIEATSVVSDGVEDRIYNSSEQCLNVDREQANTIIIDISIDAVRGDGNAERNTNAFFIVADVPTGLTVGASIAACGTPARIQTSGASGDVYFEITDGELPEGLSLSESTGNLYGTVDPVTSSNVRSRSVEVKATDILGRTATLKIDFTIADELVLDRNPALAHFTQQVGVPFNSMDYLSHTGGAGDISIRAADLHAANNYQSINNSLSGMPEKIISADVVTSFYLVQQKFGAEDENCAVAEFDDNYWVIYGPDIGSLLPSETTVIGEDFVFSSKSIGAEISSWEVHNLPDWMTFDSVNGTVSNKPGRPVDGEFVSDIGIYNDIKIIARNNVILPDDNGSVAEGYSELSFDIEVLVQAPELISTTEHSGLVGVNFLYQPVNVGGGASSWSIQNLPSWANFDSASGVLSGAPTAVSTDNNIEITAFNESGQSIDGPFSISATEIIIAPRLSGDAPVGILMQEYFYSLENTGGVATNWLVSDSLPEGISFSGGVISGTPMEIGTFLITATASNSAGDHSLIVELVIEKQQQQVLSFSTPGPVEKRYNSDSFINEATGGSGRGYIWYRSSNESIASVNATNGEVTINDVGTVEITVTKDGDNEFFSTSASYLLIVGGIDITLSGTPDRTAGIAVNYSFTPNVDAGVVESWSAIDLPVWAIFDSTTGEMSGAPAEEHVGFVSGTIVAHNSKGGRASFGPFDIEVVSGPPVLEQTVPPAEISASIDGVNPYFFRPMHNAITVTRWELENNPAWLNIDSITGVLSGAPLASDAGQFDGITLRARNAAGADQIVFSVHVLPVPPSIDPINVLIAYAGIDFSHTFINAGSPAGWHISPAIGPDTAYPWLTLDPITGRLFGRPQLINLTSDFAQFIVTATNDDGQFEEKTFGLIVTSPGTTSDVSTSQYREQTIFGGESGLILGSVYNDGGPANVSINDIVINVDNDGYAFVSGSTLFGETYDWINVDVDAGYHGEGGRVQFLQEGGASPGTHRFNVKFVNAAGIALTEIINNIVEDLNSAVEVLSANKKLIINWYEISIDPLSNQQQRIVISDSTLSGATFNLYRLLVPGTTAHNYLDRAGEKYSNVSFPLVVNELDNGTNYYFQFEAIKMIDGNSVRILSEEFSATPSGFNDTSLTRCSGFSEGLVSGRCDPRIYFNAGFTSVDLLMGYDGDVGHDTFLKPNYIDELLNSDFRHSFQFFSPEENAGECVLDEVTGLLWEKKITSDNENIRYYKTKHTFIGAESYVAAANSIQLCGYNDWRLPSVIEISNTASIDGVFPLEMRVATDEYVNSDLTPNSDYWVSTINATDLTDETARVFEFNAQSSASSGLTPELTFGLIFDSSVDSKSNAHNVRLVRGELLDPVFSANADGTVLDARTGLMWKLCPEGTFFNDDQCYGSPTMFQTLPLALGHAVDVNEGINGEDLGFGDWRVPNVNELQTLSNYNSAEGGVMSPFTDVSAGIAMSSSSFSGTLTGVDFYRLRKLFFTDGYIAPAAKLHLVRNGSNLRKWYRDADNDEWGDKYEIDSALYFTAPRPGYVLARRNAAGIIKFDCNDSLASVNPGKSETAGNELDENCNGYLNELVVD